MSAAAISNPQSFWQEARWQRVCAVCGRANGRPDGRGRTWNAHHVVPRQLLRRLGLPQFDTRNALRLCTDCHAAFESGGPGKIAVPCTKWRRENVCYAWRVLGLAAVQLEGKYGELDERFWAHADGRCEHCQ